MLLSCAIFGQPVDSIIGHGETDRQTVWQTLSAQPTDRCNQMVPSIHTQKNHQLGDSRNSLGVGTQATHRPIQKTVAPSVGPQDFALVCLFLSFCGSVALETQNVGVLKTRWRRKNVLLLPFFSSASNWRFGQGSLSLSGFGVVSGKAYACS